MQPNPRSVCFFARCIVAGPMEVVERKPEAAAMPGPPNYRNGPQQQPSSENNKKRKREGREERLERLRSYGIDLPDIAGMPVQLIPIHVNALQVTSRFYKDDNGASQGPVVPSEFMIGSSATAGPATVGASGGLDANARRRPTTSSTDGPSAVLDGILHRMDAPSVVARAGAESSSNSQQQSAQRSRSKDAAVSEWLQAVHRHLKDNNDRARRRANGRAADGGGDDDDPRSSPAEASAVAVTRTVVMVSFGHLWEQVMRHKKISVRRAALYLAAQLLYRSAECRQFLLESAASALPTAKTEGRECPSVLSSSSSTATSVVMEWMDRTLELTSTSSSDRSARQARHLQQEAYLLLQQLHTKGYGDMYPTLVTALLRFRQIHGNPLGSTMLEGLRLSGDDAAVAADTASGLREAAELRLARDQALQFWEKEEGAVHKLLRRAGTFMDVLVPRFGFEQPPRTRAGGGAATNDNRDDDDTDDDSVDWEDGGLDDDEGNADALPMPAIRTPAHSSDDAHETAVERTLAAMEATGGLKAGEIEVSFEGQPSGADDLPTNDATTETLTLDSEKVRAKAKLELIVTRLSKRHLPRLVAWTEGLVQADGLVESSNPNSRALVSMPSNLAGKRKLVLDRLVQLRGAVASVLSSAKRLGIVAEPRPRSNEEYQQVASGSGGGRSSSGMMGIAGRPARAARLATALEHWRVGGRQASAVDATRGRSNRIQVKYRKS
jgi:hypothetical protein